MKQHLKQAHDGHPKAALSGTGSRKVNRAGNGNGPALQTSDIVSSGLPGSITRQLIVTKDDLPPSTLLMNPFRTLSDPADMEGKISSIKESGNRC